MLGLLLNWRPRVFLDAVTRAVPSATGVLIQFPLYGGIASIPTGAKGAGAQSLAQQLAAFFTHIATPGSFPVVMGLYLQDFPGMGPPDFLGMGPPDFLGMDPPNFLGMGPPAGAAFQARRRTLLRAAAASGAERRCQEAMHLRG